MNEKGEVILYLSAVSIYNIYSIIRKFLGHKKILIVIETIVGITETIGTTQKEITQALINGFSDFEDPIQYSSALYIEDLDAIITRNTKDYKKANVAVMTHLNFLKLKENKQI